jgi:hypothetical protein
VLAPASRLAETPCRAAVTAGAEPVGIGLPKSADRSGSDARAAGAGMDGEVTVCFSRLGFREGGGGLSPWGS